MTGVPQRNLHNELQKMHLGTFRGPAGTVQQRTEATSRQTKIFATLGLQVPPKLIHLDASPSSITA